MNTNNMKATFVFYIDPIKGYDSRWDSEIAPVNLSIRDTVHGKLIDLPCIPTKEMIIDLSQFEEVYEFSETEMSWIDDSNNLFSIDEIIITPTHLEIWLEKHED